MANPYTVDMSLSPTQNTAAYLRYKRSLIPPAIPPSQGGPVAPKPVSPLPGVLKGNTEVQMNNQQQQAPQDDPMTKFNLAILDMLKRSQGINNENLYQQHALLSREAINRQQEMTPEALRVLSPSQQEAVRSGKTEALNPELDAVVASIKAQDSRISNFERALDTARQLGDVISKNITPTPEVIEGYRNMIRNGGDPTDIPTEVRNKVLGKITDEDWAAWNSVKKASGGGGGTQTERDRSGISAMLADAEKALENSRQWNKGKYHSDIYFAELRKFALKYPDQVDQFNNTFSGGLTNEDRAMLLKTYKAEGGRTLPGA